MITRSGALIGLLFYATQAWSIGNSPVPDIQNATLDSTVSLVSGAPDNGEYVYAYEVAVGTGSTGHVWRFEIDISARSQLNDPTRTFPVMDGTETRLTSELYDLLQEFGEFEGTLGSRIIEVEQRAPFGWNGGITRAGTAQFYSGSQIPGIGTGQSFDGFEIRTSRPPMIREATIDPAWFLVIDENGDITQAELDQAQAIKASLPIPISTLGPYDEGLGGSRHYNSLRDDMATAETLGWITDLTLSTTLRDLLDTAIAARDSSDGNTAIQTLETLKTALLAADPANFRQEYFDLVLLNVDVLILRTEPSPILFEPELTITTNANELHVGETWEISVSYVNKAFNDEPIEGLILFGFCDTVCANEDLLNDVFIETDSTGTGSFTLTGVLPGTDIVRLIVDDEAQEDLGTFEVTWRAEADLVIPLFIPPIIETAGGEIVRMTEITQNIGTTGAGASTTRYFISPDNPFDMNTATAVGERPVDSLTPDEESTSIELELTMPASLAAGEYTMAACADAYDLVAEASELNNCSFVQLENVTSSVGRVTDPSGNESIISVAGSSVTEGNSGSVQLPFVVSINQADPVIDLVVSYQTVDGSALSGDDYVSQSGQLTFPANTTQLSQTINVDVLGDLIEENDEIFSLEISSFSSTATILNPTAQGEIIDDDSVGPIEISVSNDSVTEGDVGQTNLNFNVSISQAHPSQDVTVQFTTNDGTATVSDNDYAAQSGAITFAAGTSTLSQTVAVPVNGDTQVETNETLTLVLSNPSANASIVDAVGDGTIINDDVLVVTANIGNASVVEGNSGTTVLSFPVTISEAHPLQGVLLEVVDSNAGSATSGVDYTALPQTTLSFLPETTELTQQVEVTVIGDVEIEADESVLLSLTAVTPNATVSQGTGTGTIVNDDVVGVSISDVAASEGTGANTVLSFDVSLDRPNPIAAVTMNVSTQNGTAIDGEDYDGVSEVLQFSPGETLKTVDVTVTGDGLVEFDEQFSLVASNVSLNAAVLDGVGLGTILNDDIVQVISSDGSRPEGNDTSAELQFTVSIDQAGVEDVVVDFATSDGTATTTDSDYDEATGQLVFPAGTSTLSQIVSVTVNGDFVVEADETFDLELSSLNAAIAVANPIGTIENDDLVALTISDVSGLEGNSGLTPFSFTVTIDQPHPEEVVSVDVGTQDGLALSGSDYEPLASSVSFAAGTATLSQTISVNVIGDVDIETDEDFSLNLSNATSNAAILDAVGLGIIENDDIPSNITCENATITPNTLWPPNHKWVTLDIEGVLDANGDPADITVTSIFQDESVDHLGDGNHVPDGRGVGTNSPEVRRERSGLGDGRIYVIGFDATAPGNQSCSGQVTVGVPHDQGQGSTPIDSGDRFDSTVVP